MNEQSATRRPEIDVLKGVALLGILVVNFYLFNAGVFSSLDQGRFHTYGTADYVVEYLVQWLVQSKFVAIFSFLVGWGIHTQMLRGEGFGSRYKRRLIGLFLLGLMHGVFAFSGDILAIYAILGVFMLRPVRRGWSSARLRRDALILLAIHALVLALIATLQTLIPTFPGNSPDHWLFLPASEIHATGSFLNVSRARLIEVCAKIPWMMLFDGLQIVALFRLGFAAAQALDGTDLTVARPYAKWLVRRLLAPALAVSAVGAFGPFVASPFTETVLSILLAISASFQALAYLAVAVMLMTGPLQGRFQATLGAAGRNSLSVYVGQSVVMSLLFSGYGLGLFGKVGPAAGLGLAVVVHSFLVGLAVLWSRAFRIGPLEWLLRSFTTGQCMTLRWPNSVEAPADRIP